MFSIGNLKFDISDQNDWAPKDGALTLWLGYNQCVRCLLGARDRSTLPHRTPGWGKCGKLGEIGTHRETIGGSVTQS